MKLVLPPTGNGCNLLGWFPEKANEIIACFVENESPSCIAAGIHRVPLTFWMTEEEVSKLGGLVGYYGSTGMPEKPVELVPMELENMIFVIKMRLPSPVAEYVQNTYKLEPTFGPKGDCISPFEFDDVLIYNTYTLGYYKSKSFDALFNIAKEYDPCISEKEFLRDHEGRRKKDLYTKHVYTDSQDCLFKKSKSYAVGISFVDVTMNILCSDLDGRNVETLKKFVTEMSLHIPPLCEDFEKSPGLTQMSTVSMEKKSLDTERVWEIFSGDELIASGNSQSEVLGKLTEKYRGLEKPKVINMRVTPPLGEQKIEIS